MSPVDDHRLSSNALLILASLASGDRHGYAIRKDVAARTDQAVKLGVTTLYRLLRQLLEAGLVEEAADRPAPELDDERRRYFTITRSGHQALRAEIRRLERVLQAARPAAARKVRP